MSSTKRTVSHTNTEFSSELNHFRGFHFKVYENMSEAQDDTLKHEGRLPDATSI